MVLTVAASSVLGLSSGCKDLPGDKKTQGAVIGGVGGAAAGALIGRDNALVGGLIGGALGAGGGYLIGSQLDKSDDEHDARAANSRAERSPVDPERARDARTADINRDGYVTLDEVLAMQRAGVSDSQMIDRLERTDMFFDLTSSQRRYLRDNGVSERVVDAMNTMNPEVRREAQARLRDHRGSGEASIGRD
jgi:uncharacterized membrane protein YebE (DUF533 family)